MYVGVVCVYVLCSARPYVCFALSVLSDYIAVYVFLRPVSVTLLEDLTFFRALTALILLPI